eukprot:1180610-Prorocentrum_minimum.AAC.1
MSDRPRIVVCADPGRGVHQDPVTIGDTRPRSPKSTGDSGHPKVPVPGSRIPHRSAHKTLSTIPRDGLSWNPNTLKRRRPSRLVRSHLNDVVAGWPGVQRVGHEEGGGGATLRGSGKGGSVGGNRKDHPDGGLRPGRRGTGGGGGLAARVHQAQLQHLRRRMSPGEARGLPSRCACRTPPPHSTSASWRTHPRWPAGGQGSAFTDKKGAFTDEERAFTDEEGAFTDEEGAFTDKEGASTDKEGAFTDKEGASTDEEGAFTDEEGAFTDEEGALTDEEGAFTDKEGAFTDKEGACTDKEGACTDKEGACTDKEGAFTDKEGACTGEEGACTDKEGACTGKE